jgi:O-antigen/teichoic acid export membrane protein
MVNNRFFSQARELLGNSFWLIVASVAAQSLTLLISPLLTRIYTPENMGEFALYSSSIAILTLVSTLRYDMAIISPKSDAAARILIKIILLVSLSVFLTSVILQLLFRLFLLETEHTTKAGTWFWLLPAGVFLAALQVSYSAYLLRKKHYGAVAGVRLLSAASAAGFSVTLGWLQFGVWGLLLSSLGGLLIGVLLAQHKSRLEWWQKISRRRITSVAKRYINYPRIDLPSSLLGVIGSQLPTILLGAIFGPAFIGFYALTDRILLAPLSALAGAVSSVFRVQATNHAEESGSFKRTYLNTFTLLLVAAIIIYMPFFAFGQQIFVLVFGEAWRTAGKIVEIVCPLYFFRMIASPLSMSFYVRNHMHVDIIGQALLVFSSLVSAAIGWLLDDPWIVLKLNVLLSSIIYACYIGYGYKISASNFQTKL